MKKKVKKEVRPKQKVAKKEPEDDGFVPHRSALYPYGTIANWEKHHGHGFWGNSTTGYITDEQEKKMRM